MCWDNITVGDNNYEIYKFVEYIFALIWTIKYSILHYRDGNNVIKIVKQRSSIVLIKWQIVHGTEGHMAVYGSVRHQKNIIWTSAAVYGPVRHLKRYYMDRSFWGPYNIFLVTDRSIYCHMTRSDMNYLLYYTFYLK